MRTRCPTLQSIRQGGTILEAESRQPSLPEPYLALYLLASRAMKNKFVLFTNCGVLLWEHKQIKVPLLQKHTLRSFCPRNLEMCVYLETGSFQIQQRQGHTWALNPTQLASLHEIRKSNPRVQNDCVALATQTGMVPRSPWMLGQERKGCPPVASEGAWLCCHLQLPQL